MRKCRLGFLVGRLTGPLSHVSSQNCTVRIFPGGEQYILVAGFLALQDHISPDTPALQDVGLAGLVEHIVNGPRPETSPDTVGASSPKIGLTGLISDDSSRESIQIAPPSGRSPAGGPIVRIPTRIWPKSGP